jgi:hypothetical protein
MQPHEADSADSFTGLPACGMRAEFDPYTSGTSSGFSAGVGTQFLKKL